MAAPAVANAEAVGVFMGTVGAGVLGQGVGGMGRMNAMERHGMNVGEGILVPLGADRQPVVTMLTTAHPRNMSGMRILGPMMIRYF